MDEVGLVVVAAIEGHAGETGGAKTGQGVAETEDAAELFGRETGAGEAETAELAFAEVGLGGEPFEVGEAFARFEAGEGELDGIGLRGAGEQRSDGLGKLRGCEGVVEALFDSAGFTRVDGGEFDSGVIPEGGIRAKDAVKTAGTEADGEQERAGGEVEILEAGHGADDVEAGAAVGSGVEEVHAAVGKDAIGARGETGV